MPETTYQVERDAEPDVMTCLFCGEELRSCWLTSAIVNRAGQVECPEVIALEVALGWKLASSDHQPNPTYVANASAW